MKLSRIGGRMLTVVLAFALIAGCSGQSESPTPSTNSNTPSNGQNSGNSSNQGNTSETEIIDLEVWRENNGYLPTTKGSKLYEFYKEKFGVGIIHPYVEWNGGTNYINQLNLKIAANEMPDLFQPYLGIEDSLAKNGAIADLTDLLPEYMPNVWEAIPQEVWDIVKANDPTGQGRIYYIPGILDYGRYAGMIRQDWLEELGLSMPTTQDEYVKVLEAFRDQDPNGNGQKDEVPTGGREQARWMDHLFAMYGVAMYEGLPDWDLYDGELTYSAVTPNMKAALEFIAKLYKEGLLDQETLLNTKANWDGKVEGDKAGNYFHWAETSSDRLENMHKNTGVQADYAVHPIPEVPGYEGFYTWKRLTPPAWVIKNNKDEKKLMATLKLLNDLYDKSIWNDLYLGVEGMHYTVQDGKALRLADDKSTQENVIFEPYKHLATLDFYADLLKNTSSEDRMWAVDQAIRNMHEAQKYAKIIAGDGLPASIYDGFADINNRTLYVEYATKIILGQFPIDKFDEFVEKWYKSGGEEVTKRAREWYEKANQ